MSINSIRQTVATMSSWRGSLRHIMEAKRKADEWKRKNSNNRNKRNR